MINLMENINIKIKILFSVIEVLMLKKIDQIPPVLNSKALTIAWI